MAGSQPEMQTIDCTTSFLHNLSQNFNNDSFSDVTLVIGNQNYPAHKSILAASSRYFQRMFYGGDWKEGKRRNVKLEETPDCQEIFPIFLQYFYSGSVSASQHTVVPLVTLADKYNVDVLKEHCSRFMANFVKRTGAESALAWLGFAEQMDMMYLVETCSEVMCFNFEKTCKLPSWRSLSLEQIIAILKRSDIVVPSEYTVYLAVSDWLKANAGALDRISDILQHIRFKNMTAQELMQVEKSHLASKRRNTVTDQIKVQVQDAFRHIAIEKSGGVTGTNPSQRTYLSRCSMRRATFEYHGIVILTPNYTPSQLHQCQWKIAKSDTGKYKITLSQGTYLPVSLKVRVALLIIFHDRSNAIQHVIQHEVQTTMPSKKGGTLVELPSLSNESEPGSTRFEPHGIIYSFDIRTDGLW